MQIDKLVLGDYENNCYIVRKDKDSSDCLVIDTGLSSEPLIDFLKEKNLNPLVLILTHGHGDHIAGVGSLRKNFSKIKVCIHKADANMLTDYLSNFSSLLGQRIEYSPADIILEDSGEIEFAGIKLSILHTPGHTPGGICLYNKQDNVLFSGDTLFAGSVGRTDFSGQDTRKSFEQIIENIRKKLMVLPDDTAVLPGHGPESTIEQEKLNNPYLH